MQIKKTLLAALALSPGNKAITDIDEHQRLVVESHWEGAEIWYIANLIDIKEGDVTHRTTVGGPDALQNWVYNSALDAGIDPDGDIGGTEKRWLSLEESMREQGKAGIAGVSGGLLRWQG